jgi:putative oxidoreductase
MEYGLLLIRVVLGLTMAAHGAQKLFGMFGGHGIAGTGGFFESLGLRPGKQLATAAGLAELGGGLALTIGLLTPLAAAAIIATMIVGAVTVHLSKGFFAQNGGYEYPFIVAVVAAGIAFLGPGPQSVDAKAGWWLAGTNWGLIAIGLGVIGALVPLLARRKPPAT